VRLLIERFNSHVTFDGASAHQHSVGHQLAVIIMRRVMMHQPRFFFFFFSFFSNITFVTLTLKLVY
jgi:hypothetical protein